MVYWAWMRCNLNYENMTISFYIDNKLIILPIVQGPEQDTIVLPARCEVFRKIQLNNVSESQVIHSDEIEPGIFVSRSIVDPINTYVKFLNTTHDTKVIKNLKLKHENLSNYEIHIAEVVRNTSERINKLKNIIRKSTHSDYVEDLINICENYNDVFAIEGDY